MKKIQLLVTNFSTELTQCHISAYAASAAFFMFMSLIPILLVVCAILPYTPLTEADLLSAMAEFLPQNLVPIAVSTVADVYAKSPAVLSISAFVALWSSGKGMLAIINGLNAIHKAYKPVNYFVQRIRASIYTILLLIMILISLIVGVFGESIIMIINEKVPGLVVLSPLFSWLKMLFVFILLCLFFLLLFTYIPNTKLAWKTQVVGAIFVGITWTVFSFVFSIYVKYFTGSSIYGNMSTIIILMLWLYFGFYLLFLGALISKFLMPATEFLIERGSEKRQKASTED